VPELLEVVLLGALGDFPTERRIAARTGRAISAGSMRQPACAARRAASASSAPRT